MVRLAMHLSHLLTYLHEWILGNSKRSCKLCGRSIYVLGGSENHAESTPPFPQTTLQHRAGFSKTIAVQGSLTTFSQV